jgi:hypothetical protein
MWKDNNLLQDMIDGHPKFYKHVNDDPEFATCPTPDPT